MGNQAVKKSRFTEEQIAYALKQAELGMGVAEICRKLGVAEATFYNWKKKYGGLGPSELKRLPSVKHNGIGASQHLSHRERYRSPNDRLSLRLSFIRPCIRAGLSVYFRLGILRLGHVLAHHTAVGDGNAEAQIAVRSGKVQRQLLIAPSLRQEGHSLPGLAKHASELVVQCGHGANLVWIDLCLRPRLLGGRARIRCGNRRLSARH